jgi:hypothetical protein
LLSTGITYEEYILGFFFAITAWRRIRENCPNFLANSVC